MKKIIILVVWFVMFMGVSTWSLSMISAPNTVENLLGVAILIVVAYLSFKTECLTRIKFKKDDRGESEER